MRGKVAKRLRRFAIPIFVQAARDEQNKQFCQASHMINPKNNQIMCAGFRGIYRSVKRMWRNNEEIMA